MDPSNSLGTLLRLVDDLRSVDECTRESHIEAVRAVSEQLGAPGEVSDLGLSGEELRELCSELEASLSGGGAGPDLLSILDRIQSVATDLVASVDPGEEQAEDPVDEFFEEGLNLFLSSAVGLIADIEEEILSIESGGGADELAGNFRRLVHTLKAEFSVLGMAGGSELCHTAEDLVDACAAAQSAFPVDAMLLVVDWLKSYIELLGQDARAPAPEHQPIIERLQDVRRSFTDQQDLRAATAKRGPITFDVDPVFADSVAEFAPEAAGHLTEAEAALLELEKAENPEAMDTAFRAIHTIKGVASFLNLAEMVIVAHEAESILDAWRTGAFDASQVSILLDATDLIGRMNQGLEDPSAMPTHEEVVALRKRLLDVVGSGSSNPTDSAAKGEPSAEEVTIPSAPSNPAPRTGGASAKSPVATTVKVNTMRLDALVDMVGELVIAQSMVLQDPTVQELESHALSRNIAQVSKITRDLQESAMSLRMVTVRATLQKMSRLVRDVATKSGKKVRLNIVGEDTELDRTVVERIADPLVHLVRNAVDHGLESPNARCDANKDEVGNLWLSAYHQGGTIVIEIRDDGRGMDRQKMGGAWIARRSWRRGSSGGW